MSQPADWALAYAQQAKADFRAWELYEQHPEAVVAECHQLLFLQMACEKLCKAHLIQSGTPTKSPPGRSAPVTSSRFARQYRSPGAGEAAEGAGCCSLRK